MADLEIFGTRLSPFVEKVVRALGLKKLEFDFVPMKGPRDLRRWSPETGKMPVARIGGERIYDSTRILRRLDLLYPQPPLVSSDPETAARERLIEDWADESLYWLRMAILWTKPAEASAVVLGEMNVPALIAPVARWGISRQMRGTVRAQGFGRLPREMLLREFALRCDDLAALLGDRSFLCGESPGLADLAVFAQLHFERTGPPEEFAVPLAARPSLAAWQRRIDGATRP